jgi:hypothetical protein
MRLYIMRVSRSEPQQRPLGAWPGSGAPGIRSPWAQALRAVLLLGSCTLCMALAGEGCHTLPDELARAPWPGRRPGAAARAPASTTASIGADTPQKHKYFGAEATHSFSLGDAALAALGEVAWECAARRRPGAAAGRAALRRRAGPGGMHAWTGRMRSAAGRCRGGLPPSAAQAAKSAAAPQTAAAARWGSLLYIVCQPSGLSVPALHCTALHCTALHAHASLLRRATTSRGPRCRLARARARALAARGARRAGHAPDKTPPD